VWQKAFDDNELRMNLFSIYIFIEIGGTGGGCFRYMYSRFLKESADITGNRALEEVSTMLDKSGRIFSEIGLMLKDIQTIDNINEKIEIASEKYREIAEIEGKVFTSLEEEERAYRHGRNSKG